jgi:hypothetical protein
MSGIVPTLKTHHRIRPIGEQIDDLALAFIAPLSTDYYYCLGHKTVKPL